jgi:uncharacterized protein YbaR (Trm112 family)
MSGATGMGGEAARDAGGLDRRMLEALVCPVTQATLVWDPERQELLSQAAGLAYPVRQGIPLMLPDEARKLED